MQGGGASRALPAHLAHPWRLRLKPRRGKTGRWAKGAMGANIRHILITIIMLTVGFFATVTGLNYLDSQKTHVLVLGAGARGGEAFTMATAIARLAEKHDPKLKIIVAETGGSGQNSRMLHKRLLQLATIQADSRTTSDARLITALYPDAFQLLVRADAGINSVADLRGKSIALPGEASGQYRSFLFLTRHYGLLPRDMKLIPMSAKAAEWAMLKGGVDALFQVRAPGNQALKSIIHARDVKLLPIEQTKALKLIRPALSEGLLPAGSYRGAPPVPEKDLPVPVVQRLLVSSSHVAPALIERLTRLIYEYRRELAEATPLAGFIADPTALSRYPLPLHEGARRYYERDEPSFLQENAEVFAFYLTLLAGAVSLLLQFNSRAQKARVDAYNRELIAIYNQAVTDDDPKEEVYRDRMMEIFARVLKDSEDGHISSAGFEFLAFAWDELNDAIIDAVREKTGQGRTRPAGRRP